MKIERIQSDTFAVAKFADKSIAIFNGETQTVYSLNASAAAAWDACSRPATISDVVQSMRESLGPDIDENDAVDALEQLQEKGLLKTALPARASRRSVMRVAAMIAPVVLALTSAEQVAFAQAAVSGGTTPTTTSSTTTLIPITTPPITTPPITTTHI